MPVLDILVDGTPSVEFSDWDGEIERFLELVFFDAKNQTKKIIFGQKHVPNEIREWIRNSRNSIMLDDPPEYLRNKNSLAQAIEEFYEKSNVETIENHGDLVLNYRKSHDFRFAFRGTDIPITVLGKTQGEYTISTINSERSLFFVKKNDLKDFLYSF